METFCVVVDNKYPPPQASASHLYWADADERKAVKLHITEYIDSFPCWLHQDFKFGANSIHLYSTNEVLLPQFSLCLLQTDEWQSLYLAVCGYKWLNRAKLIGRNVPYIYFLTLCFLITKLFREQALLAVTLP